MFKTLPGFREFLPEECRRRNFYFSQWRRISRNYHFQEFDGPVLEPLELYEEKSGPEIREQLFCFTDKGGREVALRPEMTPTLARLVGPRLGALRKPVKWFSIGEQYRYERYQKGRKRAFYQYNADIIGEAGPSAEVELMALLIDSLCSFGLSEKDFAVRLSDRQLWIMYLRGLGIEEARAVSVLGVVDKLGREPEDVLERKLEPLVGDRAAGLLKKMIEFSRQQSLDGVREMFRGSEIALDDLENRLADWNELLQGLQAMGLSPFVQIDLGIVRGLAYYTGFVFEAFDREKSHRALAGGGRYDNLLGMLSRKDAPAAGFGMGDVVLEDLLKEKGLLPQWVEESDVYIVGITTAERPVVLSAVRALRQVGLSVAYSLPGASPKKQFKGADEAGARTLVVIGPEEREAGQVKVKDSRTRVEKTVSNKEMIACVHHLLQGGPESD